MTRYYRIAYIDHVAYKQTFFADGRIFKEAEAQKELFELKLLDINNRFTYWLEGVLSHERR